jgi:protein SCO1/2
VRVPVAAALAAALLVGLSACGAASGAAATATASPAFHGTALDPPLAKPTTTFTDTDGQPFRIDEDTRRHVTLVYFGYTHCTDVCPAVLADLAAALRPLDPATRKHTVVLYVTVDPARDTPAVMRTYLARFDPTFVGLTAPFAQVQATAADLGVAVTRPSQDPGSEYEVDHGAQVIGFAADGLGRVLWLPGTPVDDITMDVRRLASMP